MIPDHRTGNSTTTSPSSSRAAKMTTTTTPPSGSGNPFDDRTAFGGGIEGSSPRSVTNQRRQQGQQQTQAQAGAQAGVLPAMNPFDDPEILRSAGMATGMTAGGTDTTAGARPPLATSMGGGGGGTRRGGAGHQQKQKQQRHRSARTLCTSELSSIAAQAAAGGQATGGGQVAAPFGPPSPPSSGGGATPPHVNNFPTPPCTTSVPSSPTAQTTKETSQALSDLAAALSAVRPRCNTAEETLEESAALARVTLGEMPEDSTGKKKGGGHRRTGSGSLSRSLLVGVVGDLSPKASSRGGGGGGNGGGGGGRGHRRTSSVEKVKHMLQASPLGGKKKSLSPFNSPGKGGGGGGGGGGHHRPKAKSLNMADMMSIVDDINADGGGSSRNLVGKGGGGGVGGLKTTGMFSPGGRRRKVPRSPGGSRTPSPSSGGATPSLPPPPPPPLAAVATSTATPPAPDFSGAPARDGGGGSGSGSGSGSSTPSKREEYKAKVAEHFVSETSLIGAEFMPSVPDLDVLLDDDEIHDVQKDELGSSNDDDDKKEDEDEGETKEGDDSVEASTTSDNEASDEVTTKDSFGDGSQHSSASSSIFADSKRDTVTNMPPPSAVASEVIPSLRSSEQDPTPHQVDIPPVDEFVLHARLCTVLDEYRVTDQNFQFRRLAGMSRGALEAFVEGGSNDDAAAAAEASTLQPAHQPIVSSLLEAGDDVVVEGFVHETGSCSHGDAEDDTGTARDKAPDARVEVAIFYSARHRQFVVVWQGPADDQAKPVRNRHLKAAREMLARDPRSADLSTEQQVPVFPAYRDSYFRPGVEQGVFALLDELSDRTPFCDVVMTGHSYGSALATLAAARYASSRSQIRVCCSLFGAPKVGGVEFRHWANSLPNLKVMRVEYGSDPWVNAPEGASWSHVGHTIVIDASVTTVTKPAHSERVGDKENGSSKLHPKLGDHEKDEEAPDVIVKAYRFDQHRPHSSAKFLAYVAKSMTGHHHSSKSEKNDHALSAYVYAVDRIARLGLAWVSDYVGEDAGEGVIGKNDHEKRTFV